MPPRRARVERIDDDHYRITFPRALPAEVALMYFGFYPDAQLHWHRGRVTAVVATAETYRQLVADFAESDDGEQFG